MERYFLTVEWCKNGHRGIFASREGSAFAKDRPHTEDEMAEILGVFDLILNPESRLFSNEEVKQYQRFVPLAEYSYQYGIALVTERKRQ